MFSTQTIKWRLPMPCTIANCTQSKRFNLDDGLHSHYKNRDNCCYLINATCKPNIKGSPIEAIGFAVFFHTINIETTTNYYSEGVLEKSTTEETGFRTVVIQKKFTEIRPMYLLENITAPFYTELYKVLDKIKIIWITGIEKEMKKLTYEFKPLPDFIIELIGSYDERGNDSWILVNNVLQGFEDSPTTECGFKDIYDGQSGFAVS